MKTDWKECEESNWHCAANVFPLLERDELEALAEDIKAHGLLNPIIRCDGKVLDGRNRALACRLVQVEPRFRDIPLEDALIWARSQNCLRRHLKPTEDALALLLM
jgi:ParB-like chromosome segregation protein Spo0J